MALAELLRTLEDEAQARVAAVLARARADADRLVVERTAELDRRRDAELAAREVELRAEAGRAVEAARRLAAGRLLGARGAALERIRQRAETLLAEHARGPRLLPLLTRDLELALEYTGAAPAIVEAPAPLLEALREHIGARNGVRLVATDGGPPGLVVRTADGALTVDATLQRRLDRAWPRLAIELVGRLEAAP